MKSHEQLRKLIPIPPPLCLECKEEVRCLVLKRSQEEGKIDQCCLCRLIGSRLCSVCKERAWDRLRLGTRRD